MSKPKTWPASLPYLTAPSHDRELTLEQVRALRTRPPQGSSIPQVPTSSTAGPYSLVRIQPIHDASHPANGQHGLFAVHHIKPGTFILAYLGRVHCGSAATNDPLSPSAKSDYDLWLDRDVDVAVDAALEGNEGRFVNDYRGVAKRANAEFAPVWCERWGELCIGIWAVGGGGSQGRKKLASGVAQKNLGIRKGEEILVSYGKGFWEERHREQPDAEQS